jgi:hypothetical protein
MLPGFRFLFAAIFLSMSVLVFGLGAAALLRAAHEEFASNSSWHGKPETTFAQPGEAARPVLAMLRLDPPVTEKPIIEKPVAEKPSEDVAVVAPAEPATTAEQAQTPSAPAEPDKIAALKPEGSSLPEAAKSEIPSPERPAPSESPQQSEAALADAPASVGETKVAADGETVPPAHEAAAAAAPLAPEPTGTAALPQADAATTKIATLGGPPVAIEAPLHAKPAAAKPVIAKPDQSIIRKRQQARRAAQNRRIAAERARLARQTLQQQQAANPFFQPATQPATTR